MEYREIVPWDRSEIERLIDSGEPTAVADGILSAAFHEPDWRWVQAQCVVLLDNPNNELRSIAVVCLGHIARIHGQLNADVVVPILRRLLSDSAVAGVAEDALEDIRLFVMAQ